MKKKLLITLMSGVLMVSLLAACGKNEEAAPANDNNTAVEDTAGAAASPTDESASTDSGVGSAVTVESDNKEFPNEIVNGYDGSVITVKLDENNNITNFDEIVTPYRDKIAEMLGADLTDAKAEIKNDGAYGNAECIDVDVNSITDDDPWLYENRTADYLKVDDIDAPYGFIERAVYDKFYLAAVYKVLDKYGVSKDAVTSFESYSSYDNAAGLFNCTIDSDTITEINCSFPSEIADGYNYVALEVRCNGSLVDYTAVLPCIFRVQ